MIYLVALGAALLYCLAVLSPFMVASAVRQWRFTRQMRREWQHGRHG